jgi:hypothetical protein
MQTKAKRVPHYETLHSSAELGWSTFLGERRSYRRSESSDPVAPKAEIAIVLGGSTKGTATYKMGGSWPSAQLTAGSISLKQNGGKYDEYDIASPQVQVLDLCLPEAVFGQLSVDDNLPATADRFVRYESGMQDGVINQVGLSLLLEMMRPTSAGRMLAETSSLLLAARLVQAHLEVGLARLPGPSSARRSATATRSRLYRAASDRRHCGRRSRQRRVSQHLSFHARVLCHQGPAAASVRQPKAPRARQGADRGGADVDRGNGLHVPIFLAVELHPCMPASHGHGIRDVSTRPWFGGVSPALRQPAGWSKKNLNNAKGSHTALLLDTNLPLGRLKLPVSAAYSCGAVTVPNW